jgi:hypothetical protein
LALSTGPELSLKLELLAPKEVGTYEANCTGILARIPVRLGIRHASSRQKEAAGGAEIASLRPSGRIWSISPARCGIEERASGVVWMRGPVEGCRPHARPISQARVSRNSRMGSHPRVPGDPPGGDDPVRHGYILSQEGWSEAVHLSMIGAEGMVPATSCGKEPSRQ